MPEIRSVVNTALLYGIKCISIYIKMAVVAK